MAHGVVDGAGERDVGIEWRGRRVGFSLEHRQHPCFEDFHIVWFCTCQTCSQD